jgi:hypothetical protein
MFGIDDLLGLAGPVIGGLLGGSSGGSTQTAQQQLDPTVKQNMYDLLGGVNSTFKQQFANGGMNPIMNAGMQQQQNVLSDPAYTQGFGAMRNLGLSLMGGGIAGNPFYGGGSSMGGPGQMPQMPQHQMPQQPQAPNYLTPQVNQMMNTPQNMYTPPPMPPQRFIPTPEPWSRDPYHQDVGQS